VILKITAGNSWVVVRILDSVKRLLDWVALAAPVALAVAVAEVDVQQVKTLVLPTLY
jgi:hypothetical protein